MKVSVLAVGRVKGPLEAPVRDFETRAARYWKLEVIEVDGGTGKGGDPSPEAVRTSEAARLLARVPQGTEVVALTRAGTSMTSADLARYLEDLGVRASPGAAFLIGGAFGLDRTVLERAQRCLALSPMTLPHEMARLVLAEQLYRAGTILRNEPYHKGSIT